MANTKSARKAGRVTLRRTAINKPRRTEMRTSVRKVEEAIAAKDPKAAAAALLEAESNLARAAQKGIVHKNAAARKISRLTKRTKAISAQAETPGRLDFQAALTILPANFQASLFERRFLLRRFHHGQGRLA